MFCSKKYLKFTKSFFPSEFMVICREVTKHDSSCAWSLQLQVTSVKSHVCYFNFSYIFFICWRKILIKIKIVPVKGAQFFWEH